MRRTTDEDTADKLGVMGNEVPYNISVEYSLCGSLGAEILLSKE